MPVYNGARFVKEAIDSILNQTLQTWTLIAIDDGSTDDTVSILRSCALRDSRVQVHVLPKNLGAIGARNAGIAMASTEFVAAMDADDISLPNRLEAQLRYLDMHPEVGVLGSYVQFIDDQGGRGAVKTGPSHPALVTWLLFFLNSIAHPSLVIRRSLLDRLGGYSPSCRGGTEDFELVTRASRLARVGTIPEVLVLYRRWQGNMTRMHWEAQEADAVRIVQESVSATVGRPVDLHTAAALRGLPTESYPRSAGTIGEVASVVYELARVFPRQAGLSESEAALVRHDAAIKLLLLAALAITKSPALAARLTRKALALDRNALIAFGRKAAHRLNPLGA